MPPSPAAPLAVQTGAWRPLPNTSGTWPWGGPTRTGALRASARTVQDGAGTAAVTFDVDYAVYQHEDLTYQDDDGGPKFPGDRAGVRTAAVARLVQAEIGAALRS